MGTLQKLKANVTEVLCSANLAPSEPKITIPRVTVKALWRPPPLGHLKVNSDASFMQQHRGKVNGGYVFRDHEGNFITGNTYSGLACSPLVAEALVLRDALVYADNLRIEKILVESDNLQLVQAFRGEKEYRSTIINLVQDISRLRSKFISCGFTWIGRDRNGYGNK